MLGAPCVSGKNYCYCRTGDVGEKQHQCGTRSPGRTARGTRRGAWVGPSGRPPQGLAATTTRGPRAGEQGSSLCRGRSESASRARHTLRFTFLGKQCPVMSASARPVWVGAFHTVGCEVTEGGAGKTHKRGDRKHMVRAPGHNVGTCACANVNGASCWIEL